MSLPIVIIFERHWDIVPKFLAKNLLPDLAKQGYDTLCVEAPQNISSTEIMTRHDSGLKSDIDMYNQAENFLRRANVTAELSNMSFRMLARLMHVYVSSKKYNETAEKIKCLPASRTLKDIFEIAKKLSFSVQGVDIDAEDFDAMTSTKLSERGSAISRNETHRMDTIFRNLQKLRSEQNGVIFMCGVFHADHLLTMFQQANMQDDVLYYFPHSTLRFEDSVDDVKERCSTKALLNHTFCLSKEETELFAKRVVREITPKIKYIEEVVEPNSHTQFLSRVFNATFKPFLRQGYFVDALVNSDETDNIENIRKSIAAKGLYSHDFVLDQRRFFVISAVNTKEVADKIRTL